MKAARAASIPPMLLGMETDALALLTENPEWRLLLAAYAAAEAMAAERVAQERRTAPTAAATAPVSVETPSSEDAPAAEDEVRERRQTWVRRLPTVDGLASEQLPPLHGRLIAEGLLQFDLGGRDEGVVYRLTREARLALAG